MFFLPRRLPPASSHYLRSRNNFLCWFSAFDILRPWLESPWFSRIHDVGRDLKGAVEGFHEGCGEWQVRSFLVKISFGSDYFSDLNQRQVR